jgi:dolichol-phosphate mannosyltransferase
MKEDETLARLRGTVVVRDILGVPDYEVVNFAPVSHRYLVCVFVINEGERVRAQLARMKPFKGSVDIVVADGGSTDGSLDHRYLESCGVTALLTKRGDGKLSAQMRMAFHFALANDYQGVITIDGNGKDGVSALPAFAALLDEGYDHIQGSRYVLGGHHENTPKSRHVALKLLHAPLISIASGVRQTDTTNGFRGYSANLLSDPEVAVFRDVFQTYELHYHLAIESGRLGRFRITETPTSRVYPKQGKTPTKISPIRGNAQVFFVLLSAVLGRYRLARRKSDNG